MPDLLQLAACAGLPALPSVWPSCLRLCGLPPQSLAAATPVGTFPPFVLALHLFMCDILEIKKLRDENSGAPPLCASRPPGRGYPMRELVGPLPCPEPLPIAVRNMSPSEWGWEHAFLVDLLLWLAQLHWMPPGAGQVTFIELALDFEATAGRALPPTPQSSLQGVPLSLQEWARVLRVAFVALKRHSVGPPPFLGAFVNRAPSLVPLGAGPQAGLSRRPYFVSRGAMARQLRGATGLQRAQSGPQPVPGPAGRPGAPAGSPAPAAPPARGPASATSSASRPSALAIGAAASQRGGSALADLFRIRLHSPSRGLTTGSTLRPQSPPEAIRRPTGMAPA